MYATTWYSSDVYTVSPGIEASMLYNRWAEMPSTFNLKTLNMNNDYYQDDIITLSNTNMNDQYIITGLNPDMTVFDEFAPTDVDQTLNQRGQRYGEFKTHAQITQDLKEVMRLTDNWELLQPFQVEALEMIAHKIGRILNGDPNYDDSWIDIAGYAKLVADRVK